MADDNNPIIDLSQIEDSNQNSASTNDILSLEEELLGTRPSADAGTSTSGTTSSTTAQKPKKEEGKFHIPQFVRDEHPNLIPLILNTESMDDEEREYWFQILPIMTADQIDKFKNILVTEKEQLAKLDEEYETELAKINEKHLKEWKEFESKQARLERIQKEEAHRAQESSTEEDLLKKLQNL